MLVCVAVVAVPVLSLAFSVLRSYCPLAVVVVFVVPQLA